MNKSYNGAGEIHRRLERRLGETYGAISSFFSELWRSLNSLIWTRNKDISPLSSNTVLSVGAGLKLIRDHLSRWRSKGATWEAWDTKTYSFKIGYISTEDYLLLDDLYTKLADRISALKSTGSGPNNQIKEKNDECLKMAEDALTKINWTKYK